MYKTQIDLCAADQSESAFAQFFSESIFDDQFSTSINTSNFSQQKLQHLYFETQNIERIQGQKTFGIGYPLLLFTDSEELIVAPIFIRSLQLMPDTYNKQQWHISGSKNQLAELNQFLAKKLKDSYAFDIAAEFEALPLEKKSKPETLIQLTKKIIHITGAQEYGNATTIIPVPGIDVISALPESGGLHWSAVLSIYPPQTADKKHGSNLLNLQPTELSTTKNTHPFGLLPLSPCQATAFNRAINNNFTTIKGAVNSGKSYLLTSLLTNVLSNGKKCLVVSDSAEALKKAQKGLTDLGIYRHHFLLKDTRFDKTNMLEVFRSAVPKEGLSKNFNPADFAVLRGKAERLFHRLNNEYAAAREPVFGKYNRSDLVGFYLRGRKNADKDLLNVKLNPDDFLFNPTEYEEIGKSISISHVLFDQIKSLNHPLEILDAHIFKEREYENALSFISKRCRYFIEKSENLLKKFARVQDFYLAELKDFHELYYREFTFRIRSIREKISDAEHRYNEDFVESGTASLQLSAIFSSQKKEILNTRKELVNDYKSLAKSFNEKRHFDFDFIDLNNKFSKKNILKGLADFENELAKYKENIPLILVEELKRVNSKNANKKLKSSKQLADLEKEQDQLQEEINSSGLFEKGIENKMLTTPMRRNFTEKTIEQLSLVERNLRDFPVFYRWQKNWLHLSPKSKKVISALAAIKAADWKSAYEAWYFHQSLNYCSTENMPLHNGELRDFVALEQQLQAMMLTQIEVLQNQKQSKSIKSLKKDDRSLFNGIFSKSGFEKLKTQAFSSLFEVYGDKLSDIFPVLFTGVQGAAEMIKNKTAYFDFIFIIESIRTKSSDITPLLSGGKQVVVFANQDYKNEESISDILKHNGCLSTTLKGNFLNNKDLNDEQQKHFSTKIIVNHIDGRFKEQAQINEAEIQLIDKLISEIPADKNRILPSVGILTFSKAQRNAVAAHLLHLKQNKPEKAEKIRQLERNGLGIFFGEDIIGQKFDRLIVSLTFGSTGPQGRTTRKIKFFETPAGLHSVKYLIDNAHLPMHIISSLSEETLSDFVDATENNGAFFLGQLINYAESIHRKDFHRAQAHHAFLIENKNTEYSESVFDTEVRKKLKPFFVPGRVLQKFSHNGITIPLAVTPSPDNKKAYRLQADGFLADAAFTSLQWEVEQRQMLEKKGIVLYSVYSTEWWKNPEKAAAKLAAAIIKEDNMD